MMKKCIQCGHLGLKRATEEHSIDVAGRTFTADLPILRCPECGETYTDALAMNRAELEAARRLANVGEATGETFRFMRHALGLTAVTLGVELGVAAETISRWERGERDVDRLAWMTLAAMVTDRLENETTTADRLRAMRERPRLAKAVRLDIVSRRRDLTGH